MEMNPNIQNPCYNEHIFPLPWCFVIAGFRCINHTYKNWSYISHLRSFIQDPDTVHLKHDTFYEAFLINAFWSNKISGYSSLWNQTLKLHILLFHLFLGGFHPLQVVLITTFQFYSLHTDWPTCIYDHKQTV